MVFYYRCLFFCLLLQFPYFAGYSEPGWIRVPSGTSEDLHTIYFFNADTGYAASRRSLLKTFDGGQSWQSTVMDSTHRTYDIFLFSPDRGISVRSLFYYRRGCILGTTNGGIAWDTLLYLGPEYSFYSIFFLDDLVGWVSGAWSDLINYHSFTVKTADGGMTWSTPGSWCGADIYSLFFLDSDQGFAAGYQLDWNHYERLILMSTGNGGVNWNLSGGIPWLWGELKSVYFFDSSAGYTAGMMQDTVTYYSRACVFKSTDGGVSWQLTLFDPKLDNDGFNDVYFTSADTGWVISGGGKILWTIDGGIRWRFQESGLTSPLNDVFFLNANTGWIAGDEGIILKTTTGGVTAVEKNQNKPLNIPEEVRLFQNYPNPFNSSTRITFFLEIPAVVTLQVFDIAGQQVATLISGEKLSGEIAVPFQAGHLPSGVYICQLTAGNVISRQKMVLIR